MSSSRWDSTRQGELAEAVFVQRAMEMGFRVSRPYGESCAYDFIVEWRGRLMRVQVKSVAVMEGGTYHVGSGRGGSSKRGYTAREIDVLAAYVIPEETWYLIPVAAFSPAKSIHLCPHRRSRRKFEKYREAWEGMKSSTVAGRWP